MCSDIASKWNSRYAYSGKPLPAAALVLRSGEQYLPKGESLTALDLACGRAANGHWLANRGFDVTAWDISETVVDEIRNRNPALIKHVEVRDVEKQPPEPRSFDVIVVARFLNRELCDAIQSALKAGGVLYYQTFTHGLSNVDYLLKPRELLSLFPELTVLEHHEPIPDKFGKAEARLIARRSS